MASFRWGAMNEDTYQYVYYSSGPVNVGTVHTTYHTYTIATEISGLSNQDYRIGFTICGSRGGSYIYSREIKSSPTKSFNNLISLSNLEPMVNPFVPLISIFFL